MTAGPGDEFAFPGYRQRRSRSSMSQRWVRELGPDTALWLAAVPQWSVPLAQAARLPLPSRESSVEDLVQSISLAGVAARRTEPSADGGDIELFWVDEASRRSWIEELVRQSGDLSRRVAQIATRVSAAASRAGEFVPTLTRQWLNLVGSSAGESGDELFYLLARLVRSDKLAEAAVVTDAGAAIGLVQGGSYPAAVWRGRRLVQAGHRRRRDRKALAGFVRCDEQITPLRELITSESGDPWALHLLGPGGVGKSMLVCYLASDLFPAHNHVAPFTVARVDFDHISQDYPVDRPVQLLTELADDIWTDAATSDRPLHAFTLSTRAVNAAAAAAPLPPDHPLVAETAERFAAYLQTLPAPQVLVLDTCEELAKLHPAGSEAPAVTRTFQLLEAVRENCPTMRAVFAGRRYLARAGADWTLPREVTQDAVASLEVRGYLRLVELKGFDAGDARQVLLRPHPVTGTFPSRELIQAILDRSPEIGGEARAPEPGRYNPFMIAHFRHWWEADPGLTPLAIEQAGPDAYVAGRIVSRLQDRDIADLLPAVIVLGRFDEEMLAAAMDEAPDAERLDQVVQALAEQEWITLSIDVASGLRVLAVSPGLLPMLWEWTRRPEQQPRLAAARERLAEPLRDRLENAPLPSLTAELVVAALREYPPGLSAVAWAGVEQRVETEGRWDWAGNMLRRVRGELRADLAGDPLLDAALTATALAAQWRDRPTADMSDAWLLVENLLKRVEVQLPARARAVLERLAARARLGRERARPATHDGVFRLLAALVNPDPAPLASVVAALEAQLAPVPMAGRIELGLDAGAAEVAAAVGSAWGGEAAVVAGALVALATLVPYRERGPILDLAVRQAAAAAREGRPPAWADRPLFDRRDPQVWVALHQAARALATGERVDQPVLDAWTGLAGSAEVHSIDVDRLMGCCAEFMTMPPGGTNGIPASWSWVTMTRYDPAVRATDAVHRETPPRAFAVARLWYRAGTPSRAEGLIDEWRRQALDARADDAAVREADTALAWLAIRMRWADYRPTAIAPLRQAPGAGAALSAALGYLADGDAGLNAGDVIAQLTTQVPGWLGADIAAEVQLASAAAAPDVLARIAALRDFDPVTACQLATALALREAASSASRWAAPGTIRLVRERYEAIPARAGLPSWGSTGTDNAPDSLWYWWRLRWSVLDGSGPADAPVPVPAPPELLPYFKASRPGTSPVRPRRRSRSEWAIWTVLQLVTVVGTAVAGVFLSTNSGGLVGTAGWLTAGAAVLGGISAFATQTGGRVLRRLARPFVLTVTVFDDPREIAVRQDYDRAGGWLSSLLRPVLPRRWGPAPRGDGRRREPALRVTASLEAFDSVATVLDPRASRSAQDLEHDLVDVTAEDMWRYVWVRTIAGPQSPWPEGTVVVNGPGEWAGALNAAYRRARPRRVIRPRWRPARPPLRVVHRVGLPVEAGQGVVMQVSHGGDLRAAQQETYWSPVSGIESATDIDIPMSAWRAWLTVIQVTPADTTSRRDTRTASLMRRLALDAQRETGNWVLAVPAVPAGVAREIWRTLGRLARRRRVSRHTLVRCAGQIKRLIAAAGDTPANGTAVRMSPATARDIAQDVLLIGPWDDQEVSQPRD